MGGEGVNDKKKAEEAKEREERDVRGNATPILSEAMIQAHNSFKAIQIASFCESTQSMTSIDEGTEATLVRVELSG